MKKQILTMFTGLFIGAIITGGASAYAAGILAERSSHRIFVDGQEVQMEATSAKQSASMCSGMRTADVCKLKPTRLTPARLPPLKLFRLLLRLLMWMLQSRIL